MNQSIGWTMTGRSSDFGRNPKQSVGSLSHARNPKHSIGSMSYARHTSILKPTRHVTLDRTETIDTHYRDYGFMKTNQLGTPFPQMNKLLDLDALKARLEAEKLKSVKSSVELERNVRFPKEHPTTVTQRAISFAKRRKEFDEGEFLVCKGRKITDRFHPSPPEDERHSYRLTHVPSDATLYFEEVKKFCAEYDIKLANWV